MGTSGQFVMGSIRLLAAAALLALFGMLLFAPPLAASSDDSNTVCPPHIPPFPPLPCFDLDIRDIGTPIDDESKDKLDETNENLREQRGGNWGLPSIVPADPGSVVSLDAPANLNVTPGEGYLDISWDAAAGATGYDVEAQTAGSSSWHDVASVTGTSHRYSTTATIDHVRVRASNGSGVSDWSQVSRLPAADWLDTVQSSGGASASSSGGSIASQLAAPATITVTRDNGNNARRIGSEELTVTWAAVSGAGGYNLTCSSRSGWRWWECGSVDSGSTTTLKVTQGEHGKMSWSISYMVAVRAVTNNPAQASDWTRSVDAHPAHTPVKEQPGQNPISASRSAGSLTLSWIQPKYSTGYEIECATHENGVTGTYKLCADVETATLGSDRRVTATITSWTVDGTDYTVDDSKTYDLIVRTTNAWGKSPFHYAPLIYPPPSLTVSDIGRTTATLTIAHHTGAWYYKRAGATCDGPVSGTSKDLTGLTANTTYTYSAYSDSGCTSGKLLAAATPFTTGQSISNLSNSKGSGNSFIGRGTERAFAFSTGSNTSGYVLKTVTLAVRQYDTTGSAGDIAATLHRMEGTGQYGATSEPADTVLATLSGTSPTSTTWTDTTWTCSGSGCNLSPNTVYFVKTVVQNSQTFRYDWAWTLDSGETKEPSNNGWDILFGHYNDTGARWQSYSDWHLAGIVFTPNPSLTASSVTATGATLTIGGHSGNWYYKSTTTGKTDCTSAGSASSVTLTGLNSNTSYTYSAYSDSTCTTGNLLATASEFTTLLPPTLTASAVTGTTATLTIGNHTAAWWYDANTGPDTTCQSVSAGTSSDNLTGLTAGTVYVYTAYGKSGCADADLLVTTTFGTPSTVSVSNLGKADGPSAFSLSSDYAQEFTTGSAAGGYTLSSVTLDFTIITNASQIEASIRAVQSNDTPATTARATLTGTPAAGEVTFTCDATNTNNDCSLAANTSYFVYVDALSFATNQQTTTASDDEDLQPSGNGWSIANAARYQAHSWNEHPQSLAMKMSVSATGGAASASLTATSTSLTISDYTGAWYYQANAAPHATCQGPVSGTSQAISGLTGGTSYTYKAYADSGCAVLLATAAAFTATVVTNSVSTLDGALFQSYQVGNYNNTQQQGAQGFTTGSNTGGYTLSSIDIRFGAKYGTPDDFVVTLHAASGSNPNTTTTLATLSGNTSPSTGSHTYTCSGSGCDLSASTTYFVLLAAPGSTGTSTYTVDLTSAAETKQPSNNGWSIADKGREDLYGTWYDMTAAVKMKVTATEK